MGRSTQGSDGAWPDLATARTFLGMLAGSEQPRQEPFEGISVSGLSAWLIAQGVGPMAHSRFGHVWPELGERLRGDVYSAAIEHRLHRERLKRIHEAFLKAEIPFVLLKGAALSLTVYEEPSWRPMSDIDLWVRDEDMPTAVTVMQRAGFKIGASSEERPLALQKLMDGEIKFTEPHGGLVELHWSPFSGWWLQGVASVDDDGVWERIEPLKPCHNRAAAELPEADGVPAEHFYQLAYEDALIQLAVHVSVGHKFGMWPVRSLLDIYLIVDQCDVDWRAVVDHSRRWKLTTVVWTVLALLDDLFELEVLKPVMAELQPSRVRKWCLRRIMPAGTLLHESDLRENLSRFLLLLLLVDRPLDMLRLSAQMLWPEQEWLRARYGRERAKRFRHLWRVLRQRQI